jgi:hypothetical protein
MSLVNVTCPCGVACEAIRTGDVSRPITASATTNIAEMAFRPEVCFALIVTTPFEMAPKTSVRIFQTRRGGGGLHPSCDRRIYHHHAPRVSGMSSVASRPSPDQYVKQNVFKSLDPVTGRPDVDPAHKPGTGKWADHCPSLWGGKNWPPVAFNPDTRMIYIPANDNLCGTSIGRQAKYVLEGAFTTTRRSASRWLLVLTTSAKCRRGMSILASAIHSGAVGLGCRRAWHEQSPQHPFFPGSTPRFPKAAQSGCLH